MDFISSNPEKELEKLANGLLKYPNVFILSDEIYSRITFDNHKHHMKKYREDTFSPRFGILGVDLYVKSFIII